MADLMLHLKVHLIVHVKEYFEDAQEGDKKDVFDVAPDGAVEGVFVRAIKDVTEGSSKGTPKGAPSRSI